MIMFPRFLIAAMAFVTTLSLSTLDDDPKQDNTKVDLQSIEGEWTSKDDQGESVWEFKGNKLVLKTPTRKYEIAIKVDASAKPYKTIDFNVDKDSPNAAGYKALGIYKLEGGKMTICFGSEENGRPKAFEGDFQSTFLFELTKKKAD